MNRSSLWRWALVAALTLATLWASRTGRLRAIDRPAETALTRHLGPRIGQTAIVEIDARAIAHANGDVWDAVLRTLEKLRAADGEPETVILLPPIPVAPTVAQRARFDNLKAEWRRLWLPDRVMPDNTLVPPFPTAIAGHSLAATPGDWLPVIGPRPDVDGVVWAEPVRFPVAREESAPNAVTNSASAVREHIALILSKHSASRVPDVVRINYAIHPPHIAASEWLGPENRRATGVAGKHVVLAITAPVIAPERHHWPLGTADNPAATLAQIEAQTIETVLGNAWLRDLPAAWHLLWLIAVAAGLAIVLPRLSGVGMLIVTGAIAGVWWILALLLFSGAFVVLSPAPVAVLLIGLIVAELARRLGVRRAQIDRLEHAAIVVGHYLLRRATPPPAAPRRAPIAEPDASASGSGSGSEFGDTLGKLRAELGSATPGHLDSRRIARDLPETAPQAVLAPVEFPPPSIVYGQLAALIRLMFSPAMRIDVFAMDSLDASADGATVVWRDTGESAREIPVPPESVAWPADALDRLRRGAPVRMANLATEPARLPSVAATAGQTPPAPPLVPTVSLVVPARLPAAMGAFRGERAGELLGVLVLTARHAMDIDLPEELGALNLIRAVGDATARAILDARANAALAEMAGKPVEQPMEQVDPLAAPWRAPLPPTLETRLDRVTDVLAAGGAEAERAWLALDSVPVGIALLDLDTRIVYANRAFDLRPAAPEVPMAMEPTLAEYLAARTGRMPQQEEAEFIALAGLRRRLTMPVDVNGEPRRLTVIPLLSPVASGAAAPFAGLLAVLEDRGADDRWARTRRAVADVLATPEAIDMPALLEKLRMWFDWQPARARVTAASAKPASFDFATAARDAASAAGREVAAEWPATSTTSDMGGRAVGDAAAVLDVLVDFWAALPASASVVATPSTSAEHAELAIDIALPSAAVGAVKSAFGAIANRWKAFDGQFTAEAGPQPASTTANDFRIVARLSLPLAPPA